MAPGRLAAFVLGIGLAQASGAVPAAEYSVTLNMGQPHTVPGTFAVGGVLGEVDPQPAPLAHSHVTGQGTSHAQIVYAFRVNGPALNLEVPIHIEGRLAVEAGNAVFEEDFIWGVSAQVSAQAFDRPLGDPEIVEIDTEVRSIGCNPNSVGPIPQPLPIPTCPAIVQDEPFLIELTTRTGGDNRVGMLTAANNQEDFSADFDALVDPVISFAPGFDSTGYTIELSEGVGNAVPEPGGVLMTSTGAGILLLLRRRRKT